MNQSFVQAINSHKDAMNYSPHISDQLLLASKFLWRQGYIRCPDQCDDGMAPHDCACTCPDEIKNGRTAQEILTNVSAAAS